MTETLTVTKALKELKLSMGKIESKLSQVHPYLIKIGGVYKAGISKDEAEKYKVNQKASLDSIRANIKRRTALKNAIVVSNAETRVKIGKSEMTVAEAIERKNSIELERDLLDHLKRVVDSARREYTNDSNQQESKKEALYSQLFGREKTAGGTKELEAQMGTIADKFKVEVEWMFELDDLISELEESIEKFELEVDDVLAVSNATTVIEITY